MQKIGVNNYLKIYFWRVLSIITGFMSLIIVIPHLSIQQDLYGIYVFCISFALYLTYSDIGFLSAGQKFAAEELSKNNQREEIGITGFSIFLLILFFLPFFAFMMYLSLDPEVVLSELNPENKVIVSELFLIIGLLLPIQVVLQRLVDFVLIIRLMDYISLKINITLNIVKILSVFYFFKDDNYLLTEYYLFITILSIVGSLISIAVIRAVTNYDFLLLFKSLKLSGKYYQKGKNLAFSSFALTLSFIVYHELDLIIIGTWFGIQEVAIYAIGFIFLNFVRNLWNILYSPFAQRLNHFSGQGLTEQIETMLSKIFEYTLPLYVVLVATLVLGAEYLVGYWVGEDYYSSIRILQMLMISTVLGVVIRPASYYYVSCLKYKYIYLLAVISPLVFYLVILLTSSSLGVESVAAAKIAVSVVSALIAIKGISGLFSITGIVKKLALPILIFLIIANYFLPKIIRLVFVEPYKNTEYLVIYLAFLSIVVIISYFSIILSNKERRDELKKAKASYYKNS